MFRYVPSITETLQALLDETRDGLPVHIGLLLDRIPSLLAERDRQLEDFVGLLAGDRETFSHAGTPTTDESGPWEPESAGTRLRVKVLLGAAGSSTTEVTVYVDGVSVGAVTLGAGATKGVETFDVTIAVDANVVTVAATTVGAGAEDLTVQVWLLP